MKFLLFRLIFLVLVLVSCSSDDEVSMSKTFLLTAGTWNFSNVEGLDPVATAILGALLQGTTYTYLTDGTYSALLFGFNTNGTWAFNKDETMVTLEGGTSTQQNLVIVSLTKDEFVNSVDDGMQVVTIRYIH